MLGKSAYRTIALSAYSWWSTVARPACKPLSSGAAWRSHSAESWPLGRTRWPVDTTDSRRRCPGGPVIPLSETLTGDVTFPPRKLEPPDDRPWAESGVAKPHSGDSRPVCAPYIVQSDPGPFPRVVCTSAQIRENPAQMGRKVEESSGIAADSGRTQHVVIPGIEIPTRGAVPTWGKMFGVRPVIAPRRCPLHSAARRRQ